MRAELKRMPQSGQGILPVGGMLVEMVLLEKV